MFADLDYLYMAQVDKLLKEAFLPQRITEYIVTKTTEATLSNQFHSNMRMR